MHINTFITNKCATKCIKKSLISYIDFTSCVLFELKFKQVKLDKTLLTSFVVLERLFNLLCWNFLTDKPEGVQLRMVDYQTASENFFMPGKEWT